MLLQEEGHFLNDLVIHSNGDVYVSDSYKPAVYKIDANADKIEKFVDLDGFPNGIELSSDETKLFVASSGIFIIDLETKTQDKLKHPSGLYLTADGMYFYDNSFIIIQNSTLDRVVRVHLNEELDEVVHYENLEINNPIFNIPTTGVIVDNNFYFIANSQLTDYDEKGNIFPLDSLVETQILKIPLSAKVDTVQKQFNTAEEVVTELYKLVSFNAGNTPDWEKVKDLFIEDAVIVLRTSRTEHKIFSREGFIDDFKNFISTSKVDETGFLEKIINIKTVTFGNIAHSMVVYEASIPQRKRPPQKGVDSFQLVKKNDKWLIVSIVNEIPKPGKPIPDKILKMYENGK